MVYILFGIDFKNRDNFWQQVGRYIGVNKLNEQNLAAFARRNRVPEDVIKNALPTLKAEIDQINAWLMSSKRRGFKTKEIVGKLWERNHAGKKFHGSGGRRNRPTRRR